MGALPHRARRAPGRPVLRVAAACVGLRAKVEAATVERPAVRAARGRLAPAPAARSALRPRARSIRPSAAPLAATASPLAARTALVFAVRAAIACGAWRAGAGPAARRRSDSTLFPLGAGRTAARARRERASVASGVPAPRSTPPPVPP